MALLGRQLKMPIVDWAYRGPTEPSSAEPSSAEPSSAERHLLNVI
jgi:hypothetical protein